MNNQPGTTETLDLFARLREPETLKDPYPFLAWLRENEPVHVTPQGFYFVSRYADARHILHTSDTRSLNPAELAHYFPTTLKHRSIRQLFETLPGKDGQEHSRLRKAVSPSFTARSVDAMRPRMEEITDRLLDAITEPLRDGETVDLHTTLSLKLPMQLISELIGIPEADLPTLAANVREVIEVQEVLATFANVDALPEEKLAAADEACEQLVAYYRDLFAQRRRAPQEDLISTLVSPNDDPDRLDDDELINLIQLVWIAGFETTASGIDHGALTIFDHPDQLHWLRGDHDQAVRFAEETLRYETVTVSTVVPRVTTHDIELSGVTIPEGSNVRMIIGAANRDPEAFPDPDRFDPSRDASKTLSLGYGIHYCLGAYLTRTEIAVALSKLHKRFPNLVLAADPVHVPAPVIRTMQSLPVRLA
jgi:cytochrome P450